MDGKVIGLVGGGASGKSHYIASLINLLERQDALVGMGCWYFAAADQDVVRRYEEDYYAPLFRRHEVIPPTGSLLSTQVNAPLIYEIVFERGSRLDRKRKGVQLALFDGAGEQIADQRSAVIVNRYIQNASALILLLDPMTMPGVVEHLPPHLRPVDPAPPHEALHILNNIARTYRREWGLRPADPIDVPLAITVAKSDLLRFVPQYSQQQPRFARDSSYHKGYDLNDFRIVSQEVRDFLHASCEPGFFQTVRAFSNVSYHAVSATGAAPDAASHLFSSLSPTRCMDPLAWILWKLGLIRAHGS